jgi:hypothetical protein
LELRKKAVIELSKKILGHNRMQKK